MRMNKVILFFLKIALLSVIVLHFHTGLSNNTLSDMYIVLPDLEKSFPGVLNPSVKVSMLKRLNYIRELHGLPPVVYESSYDTEVNQAAMLMAANNTITHFPDKDLYFYNNNSSKGCRISNLYLRCSTLYIMDKKTYMTQSIDYDSKEYKELISKKLPSSSYIVDQWLIDKTVDDIGHRRWILNPFLEKVSFARVDTRPLVKTHCDFITAAVLKIKDDMDEEKRRIVRVFEMLPSEEMKSTEKVEFFGKINDSHSDKVQQIIAYPYGIYPEDLYSEGADHSFSLLIHNTEFFQNENVDFEAAFVTVRDESGRDIPVSDIRENYKAYGIPNCLQWKQSEVKKDIVYTVTVNNILVEGKVLSYSYTFSIKKSHK